MKAVIFDLDGTLYDNSKLPYRLIIRSLSKLRLLKAERTARSILAGTYFPTSDDYFKALFEKMTELCGTTPQKAEKWYNGTYMPMMEKVLKKHYTYKKGVPEEAQKLREAGIKTIVFSDYGFVNERLMAVGINPNWFDFCIDAPSIGGLKPCTKSFLKISEIINIAPEDILVIGDRTDTDGEGAKRAGMKFVLVNKKDTFLHNIQEIKQ